MTTPLGFEDVVKLERDNSPLNRESAVTKIGQLMAEGKLQGVEATIAEDVVVRMAEDADMLVRSALARQIALYPLLPTGMAEQMARDVADVSVPVLQHWPDLSDELLISVISEEVEAKQVAIAQRPTVSEQVSGALIDTGNSNVVSVLLENEGARITADALQRALTDHQDHDHIPVLVAKRPDLTAETCLHCVSLVVADQLESDVANEMRRFLVQQEELPAEMASELVAHAREQAVAEMTAGEIDDEKVEEFVGVLHRSGRLTPTMLLRSLCSGDLRFVEMAFARLAKTTQDHVRAAMEPGSGEVFKSIYDSTRLPKSLRPAFGAALAAAAQERMRAGDGQMEPQRYVPTVISSIVGAYGTVAPAELEHVMAELSRELKREKEEALDSRAKMRV
ncbi:hypothetical protein BN1012_Phect2005 [Candidatus Phaeomarinobacter ectocarpi]|uniref:DUF2336 domain-containing protein n=1 Tax=Candidatus Phaeomarinibacter ectocarpi TaxID=1458461 RepID=X5M9K0_9HYPH|nr:DUF2336 domain-containing protein [Candidatus Phaeomarinobacter ectocarpi]CDO60218.1 hypothetical protein BN1012_Phect2005 [Candidatus Phaeomarinobacter ectocarpi]